MIENGSAFALEQEAPQEGSLNGEVQRWLTAAIPRFAKISGSQQRARLVIYSIQLYVLASMINTLFIDYPQRRMDGVINLIR